MVDDALIGVREAARQLGMSHTTLYRQIKSGQVRSHGGKVKLSEVLEDRANNIDASIWASRRKAAPADVPGAVHAPDHPVHAPTDDEDEPGDASETGTVLVDGIALPLTKARALKETYLARLRKLEFEEKSGNLVEAAVVHKAVFEMARQDRDSWMNWPARVSPLMAADLGIDQVALAVVLEKHVREQLTDRSRSALRFSS